ncbi:MAG: hypothetical protein ACRBN8_29980 [Nannocystales bacterium]
MKRPSDAQRMLAQYRRAVEPSAEQLARVRDRLEPPHTAPRRWPVLAVGLGSAAAAALVLAWMALRAESATNHTQPPPVQAPHEASSETDNEARRVSPTPTSTSARPAPKTTPSDPVPTPATVPSSPTPQRSTQRTVRPPPDAASTALQLAAEAKLIRRAQAQLKAEKYPEALKTLHAHARSFPEGTLTTERRALRSIALCRSGNLVQGRGEQAALRRDPASAPYRDRIAEACSQ